MSEYDNKDSDKLHELLKMNTPEPKAKETVTKKTAEKEAVPKKRKISAGKCAATVICCLPLILELLALFLIPKIGSLAENKYLSVWAWSALSLPFKISVLVIIVLGFLVQICGLFDKIGNITGAFTQLISFALFVLSAYAADNSAASAYAQWGLSMVVAASFFVVSLRYLTCVVYEFKYYIPIALAVAEYALFFLVFPLIYGTVAPMWMAIALTVTTALVILISLYRKVLNWISLGVNLVIALLLIFAYWLGIIFSSEWMWSGGIIIVVILAIGGSWFIHWFIHRNDP